MKKFLKPIMFIVLLIVVSIGSFFLPRLFETEEIEIQTITFVSPYGDAIEPISFEGEKTIELPTIAYEGYTFLGWYNGDEKVNDGTYRTSMTLVARFSQNTYTFNFEEENISSINIIYGQEIFLPTPNKEGFLFLGWFEDEAYTQPFNNETYENKTLYPKYERLGENTFAHYYISEFDGLVSEQIVNKDQQIVLTDQSKEGYTFLGWQLSGTDTFVSDGDVFNQNAVFLAIFEPLVKMFTISFETGDAEPIDPIVVEEGTLFELPEAPELFGFQFKGWVTDIVFDGFNLSSTLVTESFIVTKDVTLNANFDYMIPSEHIFYEPFRASGQVLGYNITEITYQTDEVIDYMILPQTYLGLPVVSISNSAFSELTYLKEVVVPEGYINISGGAFYGSSIQTIHLPSTLKVLDSYVFENSAIETVNFAENSTLVSIGEGVFNNASMLTSITIPNSVITIGNDAFSTSSLASITFESGSQLRLIDQNAFRETSLMNIELPNSLKRIFNTAFSGTPLTSITLGENVEYLGDEIFSGSLIESVTITNPEALLRIGDRIFNNTPILTNAGVLQIDGIIFGYDTNLNAEGFDVTIGSEVITLANEAFYSANIQSLTIEAAHLKNMQNAFENATIASSFTLPTSDDYSDAFAYSDLLETFTLTIESGAQNHESMFAYADMFNVSIVIESQLTNANDLFRQTEFDTLTLKSGVSHLHDSFLYAARLNMLYIESEMLELDSSSMRFDYLGNYETPELFQFSILSEDAFQDIRGKSPNFDVDENGYVTFANVLIDAQNVASNDLVIPSGINIINRFSLARNIETIDLNETQYILRSAFQFSNRTYTNHPQITLDETILFFSYDILRDWSSRPMTVVVTGFPEKSSVLHHDVMYYRPIYNELPFDEDGFKRIGDYIYDYDKENFGEEVIIPEGVTKIAPNTFSGDDIVSLEATSPMEFIGYGAFNSNPRLRNILTAFSDNGAYFEIYETMENGAPSFDVIYDEMHINLDFMNLDTMIEYGNIDVDAQGFYIHENILVKYVGNDKHVVIPEGIVAIARNAFSYTLVETITLPSTLQSIQRNAFSFMVYLNAINFDPSLQLLYLGNAILENSSLDASALPDALIKHPNYNIDDYIYFNLEDEG